MWRKTARTASLVGGLVICIITLALNACGGGGVTTLTAPPQPRNGNSPQGDATINISLGNVGSPVNLPPVGNFTESITLPPNDNHSATLHLTISTTAPRGMPAMTPDMDVTNPYIYVTATTSQTVTLNGFPGFSMSIPSADLGTPTTMMGFYDPSKGWIHIGNFVQTESNWVFSSTSAPVTLKVNTTYYAVPYACGGVSTTAPVIAGTTIPIPANDGFGGQFRVPANNAPAGTLVTLTTYATMPPGAPQPQVATAIVVHPLTLRGPIGVAVSFTFSSSGKAAAAESFHFNNYPATEWDLPSDFPTAGMSFYLDTFDGTTGELLVKQSASSVSPGTVTFAAVDKTFTATFGHRYWWELLATPAVTEYDLPAGAGPAAIMEGPDRNLWFGEVGLSDLGRITPGGAITQFPLPAGGTFVRRIAIGPDGNIWFTIDQTTELGGAVGRSTTGGAISTFPLPTAGAPIGITTGSDGNLWAVDSYNGYLIRVTTRGAITEFPTFTSADRPFGDVTGPDGNLWITLLGTNEIARVKISTLAVTRFPVPTPSSLPNFIISHNGSLYFEENGDAKIGIISTAGVIREIPLVHPYPPNYTGFLANGPDGDVWFADQGAGEIGSIVSGKAVEFPVPTASSLPVGITSGPNNTIWFTEYAANKIGKFTVP